MHIGLSAKTRGSYNESCSAIISRLNSTDYKISKGLSAVYLSAEPLRTIISLIGFACLRSRPTGRKNIERQCNTSLLVELICSRLSHWQQIVCRTQRFEVLASRLPLERSRLSHLHVQAPFTTDAQKSDVILSRFLSLSSPVQLSAAAE